MTVLLSILGKAWPYLLAAAIAGYGVHRFDNLSYGRLQATFEAYKVTDAVEAAKSQAAIEQQKIDDARSAQGAVNELKSELEAVRASAGQPVPYVRLCQYATRNPVPATPSAAAAAGTESGSTAAGTVPDVSAGAPVGPDIGAGLFRLAAAADVVSAEDRARLAYLRLVTKATAP